MAALTADRSTPARPGVDYEYPVLASETIWAGSMVVLDSSGWAKGAVTATGLIPAGRAEARADNAGGANGAINVKVSRGVFRWLNSASADEITKAEIGDVCFIVDDQTVAKTDGSATRSKAGIIVDVDAVGVWVETGAAALVQPASALLAANNLSDVGTAATAFANIKQAATAAATGVVELATVAEVLTGTDTGRAVTPEGVAGYAPKKLGTPVITVNAQAGNDITVSIQFNDADGNPIAEGVSVPFFLSDDSDGDSIAGTAPSGGFAAGTDGWIEAYTADKSGRIHAESADGDADIVITEAGADTWYLVLEMPDGRYVISDAITFA
jgi:hypothetical protein